MPRLFAALALTIASATAAGAVQERTNPDAATLADFTKRLNAYVELRKKADDSAAPLKKTEDPAKIHIAQQQLAERIRTARAEAKHGDLFTPEVSVILRRLLRPESKEPGTKAAIKDDNPPKAKVPFVINGAYPEKEPLSTVPPNVLASLPKLPEDVEYRFVGKHVVLRDAKANIILDYLTDAIP